MYVDLCSAMLILVLIVMLISNGLDCKGNYKTLNADSNLDEDDRLIDGQHQIIGQIAVQSSKKQAFWKYC